MEGDHYIWREECLTGEGAIDAQHRELLKLGNLLMDAAGKGRSRAVLKEAFKALFKYTEKHFREEETFWEASGLATLEQHRAEHKALKKELESLWSNETMDFVETTGGELTSWMMNRLIPHMKTVDRRAVLSISGKGD